ncbi:hypothetical protein E7744_13015 [Citricoccus sp. SGAir0253]|uniref:hypothetical protein n=1 Tax=Citricoccus sp. SGAir0253 TaxID=2567881 RepID=UPI0010CD54F4|nr:hypothetical protein [Citricoccus sp. SGAir0253]QCU78945.1 hypothetical protein E7744_13015 [Citricoccus sp. SGAir0253]
MTTRPHDAPPVQRPGRIAARLLLAAGFAAALLPVLHWSLGSAVTAMAYLVGTAALVTVGIIAVYLAEHPRTGGSAVDGGER